MAAPFLAPRLLWVLLLVAAAVAIFSRAGWCQPSALRSSSAIYDPHPQRQRMVVFGGTPDDQNLLNDSWQLSLTLDPQWAPLPTSGTLPSGRIGHSAVYDPVRDRMLVFGGLSLNGDNVVWGLSLSDSSWDSVQVSGPRPLMRRYHTAIYDPHPLRDRMIVFGGDAGSGNWFNDAWSLWLTPTPRWERIVPKGTPPTVRYGHSAIYDPVRDRMLVFGGHAAPNEVKSLSFADTSWTTLPASGTAPSARSAHSAIYDPVGDRMVVYGGDGVAHPDDGVWSLSLANSTWSRSATATGWPANRGYHAAVYDSAWSRMVLFGGHPYSIEPMCGATRCSPTWALSLGQTMEWSPLRPVFQVSTTELELPTVTLGDTVYVPFVISNVGLEPLRVTDFQVNGISLPDTSMRVSSPSPQLVWREAIAETLFLAPIDTQPVQTSLVIVSSDSLVPRTQLSLRATVLGLDFDTRVLGHQPARLGISATVVVTPKPKVRIEGGALFYRVAGGPSLFDSTALTPLSTDFIATIPAEAVTERGVEYYVKVQNSGFVATLPAGFPFFQPVASPDSFTAVRRPLSGAGSDFLEGRAIEVEAILPAGAVFDSGAVHYRRGGEQDFGRSVLSAGIHGPTAVIPDSVVGARGVEYWVELRTRTTSLRFPATQAVESIRIKVQDLQEPLGHPGSRYRLLSVPLDFGDFSGSLDDLLTELGPYNPVSWRAYSYDPVAEANVEFSDAEADRFRPMPGRAFWLISRAGHRVDTAPIAGFSTTTLGAYPIRLEQGWNQVGNPFAFPVAWGDVIRDTTHVSDPVAFDPLLLQIGDYEDPVPSVLEPFEGYFVHNSGTEAETLWVPPRAAATSPPPKAVIAGRKTASGDLWRFRLRAWTDAAVDGSNTFGLETGAAAGFDALDQPKPPVPPGPWVQVAFVHPDWQERSGAYRRDLRSPGSEGETWEIEVRTSAGQGPLTLAVAPLVSAPGLAMRIIDREQGSTIDGSGDPGPAGDEAATLQYRIVPFSQRPYRLAIVAGTKEYVARVSEEALTLPARVSLDQSAPNPFRSATRVRFGLPRGEQATVEIFSIQGQRVAVPLERTVLSAGFHTAIWDGTTSGGTLAPSGVYLMRLVAGREAFTRRVTLLR